MPAPKNSRRRSVVAMHLRAAGRRPSKLLLAGAATAATGLLLLAIIRSSGSGASTAAGAGNIKSLAVLPFSNLTGDTAQVYLAQGLTDQLVTSLAQLSALRVINLKGAKEVSVQLVKELGLDAVLAGSLQRAGNAVHISVQLNSATTNQSLWAHGYDGELSGILDLQAEVARSVASRIGASVTAQERAQLTAERPAINPAAYEAYIRGSYFQQKVTKPDLHKAIGYFQQAIDADPAYAAAWAGLAQCYNSLGYYSIESPELSFLTLGPLTSVPWSWTPCSRRLTAPWRTTSSFTGGTSPRPSGSSAARSSSIRKWSRGHHGYGLFLTAMNRIDAPSPS